jgi:hypothetical protein
MVDGIENEIKCLREWLDLVGTDWTELMEIYMKWKKG